MKPDKMQTGGALIIALLTVALVTVSVTHLLRSQSIWVQQTETMLKLSQGRQLLQAGVDWSILILADDARSGNMDHHRELWASRLPPIHTDDWEISGQIEDAQSRFNLNNLVRDGKASPADMAIFSSLLQEAGAPHSLAHTVVDWIDADNEITAPNGAEDADYLTQTPPHRTANQPLTELANLSRISGFNAEIIDRLRPLVTVLPHATPINVNTAPPRLLMAIIPGLSLSEAQTLLAHRENTPFASLHALKSRLPRSELSFDAGSLSVGSRFFIAQGRARSGEIRIGLIALIHRENSGRPRIIWKREA